MTNPGMGWLVLRRVVEKRPPQHPDQRTWVKSGVQRRTFSSESQFGLENRQGFGKMAASEAANGKSRFIGYYPEIATTSLGRSPGTALPL